MIECGIYDDERHDQFITFSCYGQKAGAKAAPEPDAARAREPGRRLEMEVGQAYPATEIGWKSDSHARIVAGRRGAEERGRRGILSLRDPAALPGRPGHPTDFLPP